MLERYIGGRLEQGQQTALGAYKLPGKLPSGTSNAPATNPSMPEEVSGVVDALTQEVVDAFKSLAPLLRAQSALVLADIKAIKDSARSPEPKAPEPAAPEPAMG